MAGSLPLEPSAEGNSFQINSSVLRDDKEFTPTLVHSGSAPVLEGQVVSVSARLSAYAATLLEKSMEMPASNVNVEFALRYLTRLPPYEVEATIDFDRYYQAYQDYIHKRKKGSRTVWDPKWYWLFNTRNKKSLDESEVSQALEFLEQQGVVQIRIIDSIDQKNQSTVESGLLSMIMEQFTNMLSQMNELQESPEQAGAATGNDNEDQESAEAARRKEAKKYDRYRYRKTSRVSKRFSGKHTFSLKKYGLKYTDLQMSANLTTWYRELKDKGPEYVAEVKLDDPFFARRTIHIVIDGETYDIFKQIANYAAVQVLPLKASYPLEKTIDRGYLEKHGQTATISYAPMGRKWDYKYAVQWSLRGGHLYPAHPRWKKGESQGITLQAPLRPVHVEAEADLDELAGMQFTRVAVELRYRQFGKAHIDRGAASISVAKGEPLTSVTVYPDKESDDLSYRLIYYHKKLGKIPEKGWKRVEGNYIYCAPGGSVLEALGIKQ